MVLKKCWAIFGLLLLPWCAWANQAVLTNIRAFNENNKTRVVLELSQPIPYKAFPLQHPARYVVDLKSAKSNLNPKQIHFDNNPMKDVRFGHPTPGIFRVVFDMENMTPSRVFALPSDENAPARIVIDFKVTQKKVKKPQPVQPAQPVLSLPKQTLRNVVVVIDPGHGGKDPGAIGVRNIKEKNVVLAISKDLYKLLQKEPGMTPAMTRDGDYFISLRGRLKKARDDKADIFIAIHADAYKNRQSHGVSIYALSPRGATSEAARWLAEKENYSELGGVDLSDKGDMLRSVLIDLSQTATITASLKLGTDVLHYLSGLTKLHQNHVEQARFVVLKSPDIPSLLIETGFISNPTDARNLNDPVYQQKMAEAIMTGIRAYFYEHPPAGTWVAAHNHKRKYVVHRGDSLHSISERYGVSTEVIRTVNSLQNNKIFVGETLVIPA